MSNLVPSEGSSKSAILGHMKHDMLQATLLLSEPSIDLIQETLARMIYELPLKYAEKLYEVRLIVFHSQLHHIQLTHLMIFMVG